MVFDVSWLRVAGRLPPKTEPGQQPILRQHTDVAPRLRELLVHEATTWVFYSAHDQDNAHVFSHAEAPLLVSLAMSHCHTTRFYSRHGQLLRSTAPLLGRSASTGQPGNILLEARN